MLASRSRHSVIFGDATSRSRYRRSASATIPRSSTRRARLNATGRAASGVFARSAETSSASPVFFSTVIALGVRRRQRAQEPPARLLEAAFVRASAGHRTQHAAVVQERRGRCAPGRDLRRPLVRRRRLGVLAGAEQRVAQLEARGEIRRVGVGGAAQRGGGLGVAPGARARLPDGHHAPRPRRRNVRRPPPGAGARTRAPPGGSRGRRRAPGRRTRRRLAVAARQRNLRQTKRGGREGFVQLRRRLVQRARARQVTAPVRGRARAYTQPPPSACPWRRRRRRRRAPRRFR